MRHVYMNVIGQVQGVGFRYFTYTMATRLGIVGWVQNLGDGSVEIRAQGPDLVMEQFIASIRQGPSYGRVDRLMVQDICELDEYRKFDIR